MEDWNGPTKIVALWVDNDPGLYESVKTQAEESWANPEPNQFAKGHDTLARITMRGRMESICDDLWNETFELSQTSGLMADLLNESLSMVNWHHLADYYLDMFVDAYEGR